jgi:hypothetical protein
MLIKLVLLCTLSHSCAYIWLTDITNLALGMHVHEHGHRPHQGVQTTNAFSSQYLAENLCIFYCYMCIEEPVLTFVSVCVCARACVGVWMCGCGCLCSMLWAHTFVLHVCMHYFRKMNALVIITIAWHVCIYRIHAW